MTPRSQTGEYLTGMLKRSGLWNRTLLHLRQRAYSRPRFRRNRQSRSDSTAAQSTSPDSTRRHARRLRAVLLHALLVSSIPQLINLGIDYVFTDGHAFMAMTNFYNDPSKLDAIDWDVLQRRDFKRDDNYPRKLERYQAETLVHLNLPVKALIGVVCYDPAVASEITASARLMALDIGVHTRRGLYL